MSSTNLVKFPHTHNIGVFTTRCYRFHGKDNTDMGNIITHITILQRLVVLKKLHLPFPTFCCTFASHL